MTDSLVNGIDSTALLVQIGDGASPENFVHPCLINLSRSMEKTAQITSAVLPDCTDPTQPGGTVRTTTSTDRKIGGTGVLDQAAAKTYDDMVGKKVNIKAQAGSITGALVVTGPFILESFSLTGAKLGELVEANLSFVQAAPAAATAHS